MIAAFFYVDGKWQNLRQPLNILVKISSMLLGRNLKVVFVIWFSPGAFYFSRIYV